LLSAFLVHPGNPGPPGLVKSSYGSAVMRAYESVQGKKGFIVDRAEVISKREPKSSPLTKKDLHQIDVSP